MPSQAGKLTGFIAQFLFRFLSLIVFYLTALYLYESWRRVYSIFVTGYDPYLHGSKSTIRRLKKENKKQKPMRGAEAKDEGNRVNCSESLGATATKSSPVGDRANTLTPPLSLNAGSSSHSESRTATATATDIEAASELEPDTETENETNFSHNMNNSTTELEHDEKMNDDSSELKAAKGVSKALPRRESKAMVKKLTAKREIDAAYRKANKLLIPTSLTCMCLLSFSLLGAVGGWHDVMMWSFDQCYRWVVVASGLAFTLSKVLMYSCFLYRLHSGMRVHIMRHARYRTE